MAKETKIIIGGRSAGKTAAIKYMQWLHKLTQLGYAKNIVFMTHTSDLVQGYYDSGKTPAAALAEYMEQACRICGCTNEDCSQCLKKTGAPCHWVAPDLCSACVDEANARALAGLKTFNRSLKKALKSPFNIH